jgi:hypothetical protein
MDCAGSPSVQKEFVMTITVCARPSTDLASVNACQPLSLRVQEYLARGYDPYNSSEVWNNAALDIWEDEQRDIVLAEHEAAMKTHCCRRA